MSENNKWEQWIESEEGKSSLEPSIVKPGNEQYLYNRIWRAFHAGVWPIDGKLENKAESLLKRVAQQNGTYTSKQLKREIENYLDSKK